MTAIPQRIYSKRKEKGLALNFLNLFETQIELVHSLKPLNSQNWALLKSGAGNST